MLEFFYNIDLWLFHFINDTISNGVLDKFMPFITDIHNWIITYVIMLAWLFWKGGRNGRIAAVAVLLTIAITDPLNSGVLKELFGRIRPCRVLDDINLLIGCGAGKSLPSSHAANMYALATVLSFYYRKYRIVYFSIAAVIAFSRVYVGVHYPFDVLCGGIVGTITGSVVLFIFNRIKFLKVEPERFQKIE